MNAEQFRRTQLDLFDLPAEQVPSVAITTRYRVTIDGRILSTKRNRYTELKTPPNAHGYATVDLNIDGTRQTHAVHSLVCRAFHGPPPFDRAHARHLDGNKRHNHADNLAWGTAQDNADDDQRNGKPRGRHQQGAPQ